MTNVKQNLQVKQIFFGNPERSLKIESAPLNTLTDDLVRVQIEAANINPSDLLSIRGIGQYKYNHQVPRTPGFEAVGTVIKSKHVKFKSGQRVVVATSGTWQKFIDVLPENLFHIPHTMERGYACQLYINALTAWVLTVEITKLTQKDVVIINAGSSAIGKIFAQLSSSLGFSLIAVTSRPAEYQYPADYVLDARDDLIAQIQKMKIPKPNVALDAIGGKAGNRLVETVCCKGRFINYGTLSMDYYEPSFFECVRLKNIEFTTFFLRNWEKKAGQINRRNMFTMMLSHFIEHQINLDVDRYIPLKSVISAIALIEADSVVLKGKIILTIE